MWTNWDSCLIKLTSYYSSWFVAMLVVLVAPNAVFRNAGCFLVFFKAKLLPTSWNTQRKHKKAIHYPIIIIEHPYVHGTVCFVGVCRWISARDSLLWNAAFAVSQQGGTRSWEPMGSTTTCHVFFIYVM